MAETRAPWIIAVAGFWVNVCVMGLYRSSAVIFVAFLETMDVTRQSATWPLALQTFMLCATGPLSGYLSQYFSSRVILFSGSLIVSSGIALCYFARGIEYIIVFYGIFSGIGYGLIVPTLQVAINQHFNRYRATAMGIAFAGTSVGVFALPALVEWILRTHGLRGTFLLLGAIAMQALPGVALMRPAPPASDPETTPRTRCFSETADIMTHPMFVVVTASYSLTMFSFFSYLTVVVDFATDRSIPVTDSPFIISAVGAGGLASRLCLGWLSDHMCVARWHVVASCMAALGLLLVTVPLATGFKTLLGPAVFIGLMYGVVSIHKSILLREYFSLERLPIAIGYGNFFIGMSAFPRPPLVGHFRDTVGSYDGLFVTAGALQIIAALMWLLEPLVRDSASIASRLSGRCVK